MQGSVCLLSSILGGGGKWCEGWRKVSCFVCYSVGGSMGENWGTICIRCAVSCVGCIRWRLVISTRGLEGSEPESVIEYG